MSTVLPIYNVGEWGKIEIAWSKNIHIHLLVYIVTVKVFIIRYTEIPVLKAFHNWIFSPRKHILCHNEFMKFEHCCKLLNFVL